jgi:hypothetical protein
MKKERFERSYRFVIMTVVGTACLFAVGINEHNISLSFPLERNTMIVSSLFVGLILLTIRWKITTYLEIQDERMLVNSGYHDFGKDIIDIHDIKYIYRIPQFIVAWYGGSLMMIYHRDEQGGIRHSALRERNYSDETLKKFLLRIKTIKPTIEIDPEYQDFLKGNLRLSQSSKNTVASVEERLKAKGESWK